jgi:DNA-binding response OmpR family regulator
MLTGIGESLNETTSPLFGADEYIDKPFDLEKLDELIGRVLAKRAAQREAVPRPVGNGVGGPAKAAVAARSLKVSSKRPAKKAKPAVSKRANRKQKGSAKAEKGKKTMAAKKAKKAAKKAKKTAKKAKKK